MHTYELTELGLVCFLKEEKKEAKNYRIITLIMLGKFEARIADCGENERGA